MRERGARIVHLVQRMPGELISVDQRPLRLEGKGLEHDLVPVDDDVFAAVLSETVQVLEQEGIQYGVIGGLATYGFGRPRTTCDIDLFVIPRDAERVIEALAARRFQTERTDEKWLFKAFKHHVQVDVIFTTAGFYFDEEMVARSVQAEVCGTRVRFIPPEDLVVIKAKCASEAAPRHWHDALAIVASNSLDWDYLVRRAARAERRVLSLLLYAQSNDVHVPSSVVRSMFERVFAS